MKAPIYPLVSRPLLVRSKISLQCAASHYIVYLQPARFRSLIPCIFPSEQTAICPEAFTGAFVTIALPLELFRVAIFVKLCGDVGSMALFMRQRAIASKQTDELAITLRVCSIIYPRGLPIGHIDLWM